VCFFLGLKNAFEIFLFLFEINLFIILKCFDILIFKKKSIFRNKNLKNR
jgi:hypothetical protein